MFLSVILMEILWQTYRLPVMVRIRYLYFMVFFRRRRNEINFNADKTFHGENIGDNAGYDVSNLGDIDGDGLDEVLIGAPNNPEYGSNMGKGWIPF